MKSKLSPKQEAFCLAYLKTGNASEAYRQAYDTAKMKADSVHREAKNLLDNPKITARLGVFQQKAEVKAMLSLEDHMEELRSLRELAKTNTQISAAIQAEVKRGELRKFYVKQVETGGAGDFARAPEEELDEFIVTETKELYGTKPKH